MNVYVAGSTREIERVQLVQAMVRKLGHGITFDWTGAEGEIRTDGTWNRASEKGALISQREIWASNSADLIVVLFPLIGGGLGCWIELGAALAGDAECWIVAPQRDSVFWQHPRVHVLTDLDEVGMMLASYNSAA